MPLASIVKLEPERRPGNGHFGNFIAAVRSRKVEDLNADILEGHYSAALCHLANISYRLGQEVPVQQVDEGLRRRQGGLRDICPHGRAPERQRRGARRSELPAGPQARPSTRRPSRSSATSEANQHLLDRGAYRRAVCRARQDLRERCGSISLRQVAPGEVGLDPLVALGKRLDPFEGADVDDVRLALGLAYGIQAVAVLGPLEARRIRRLRRRLEPGRGRRLLRESCSAGRRVRRSRRRCRWLPGRSGHGAFRRSTAGRDVQRRGLSPLPVPVHGCTHLCLWRLSWDRFRPRSCGSAVVALRSGLLVSKYT